MGIGYIGLGEMGGGLAQRLLLKHPLHVFDLNPAAVANLVSAGAEACASASEVAEMCDTIFICLPTSAHVRKAIFGDNGLAGKLRAGTRIIDQTTGDPAVTRSIAQELSALDVELIDAPVSGGPDGARAGTIAIMVGARADQFEAISPLLGDISPNIFHCGGVSTGQVMKLVNNMLSAGQRLMSLESVTLAAKNGIDPAKAVEVMMAGGGKNSFLERGMRQYVLKGELGPRFSLGLMHKDLRLACQMGVDSEVPLLFGVLTRELHQMCIAEWSPSSPVFLAAQVFDKWAGTSAFPLNEVPPKG